MPRFGRAITPAIGGGASTVDSKLASPSSSCSVRFCSQGAGSVRLTTSPRTDRTCGSISPAVRRESCRPTGLWSLRPFSFTPQTTHHHLVEGYRAGCARYRLPRRSNSAGFTRACRRCGRWWWKSASTWYCRWWGLASGRSQRGGCGLVQRWPSLLVLALLARSGLCCRIRKGCCR